MTNKNLGSLAVAAAFFAAACADPAGPTRALQPDAPLFAVSTVPGYPFPAFPSDGDIELCKHSNVAGTFDFTLTGPAGTVSPVQIIIGAGGGTVCHPTAVYHTNLGRTDDGLFETVVITEAANAVPLVDIDIIRYLDPSITYSFDETNDLFSVATRTATVRINHDMARRVIFENGQQNLAGRGCTPGYWKNHDEPGDWPSPYDPDDSFNTTFGIGTNWFLNSLTLDGAASQGGGGAKALGRHAVASLLNAAAGFAGFTPPQVIAAVQAAYTNSALISSTHLAFENYNEQRCGLRGGEFAPSN